jgi:uncharacterized protein (UPF0276 family)
MPAAAHPVGQPQVADQVVEEAAAVVEVVAGGVEDVVDTELGTNRKDRVGLGWRPELAAGIFAHQERIDVVEVIAEDWFNASKASISALRTLARQIPLQLHGVSAGMASTVPVEEVRLSKMARLVDLVQPEAWSEHLAFVRCGGLEIGHLAAAPRTRTSAESSAQNVYRASKIIGMMPMVENVATLINPPASTLSETDWLTQVVMTSDAPLLLDLHNLYANVVNFSGDPAVAPLQALRMLPLERVGTVHIAGGRWLAAGEQFPGERRWLDDHLHPVPDVVYLLLEELAALSSQPLTVILERDGAYPSMEDLLLELDLARAALRRGRLGKPYGSSRESYINNIADCGVSTSRLEPLLARLYTDEAAGAKFLEDPQAFARKYGLSDRDVGALSSIDEVGLTMAVRGFERKREAKRRNKTLGGWVGRTIRTVSRSFTH